MLRPIVYYTITSPPSRSTLLTAAAIGLDLDIRNIDFMKGEHLTPEFLKMNPQHTVPTLNDNGFTIWDSHVINTYLVGKYAKDDSLYPKDLNLRAKVDQCLYFENGSLFYGLSSIFIKPILYKGNKEIAKDELYLLDTAYKVLDKMLEGKKWLVGDSYTLADISNVCTLITLDIIKPADKYKNITRWVKRCEETLPGYAQWNKPGLEKIHKTMTSLISNL
ncbi:glutathione S-transferase 1-1-like [Belonocnema kinseyi]|uniref:glutathione S-transferase 1-1-like n=1 Tax=Belonocnema kinseyi TaxID=2817044 RepID=UPI00143D1BE6|nr:glutathione S-transferase 1-1-like [Belonocnema kinseyi]XP_033207194.1 glutathione S-transferase 1-1-like [Belonocnema kinseyi]XP_033207195.1 glutathione S-transferase 1-1-like [Belonocnema kinseyi]